MNPVEEFLRVSPKTKVAGVGSALWRGMKFQGLKGAGPHTSGETFANVLGNQLTAGAAVGAVTLGGEAAIRGTRKLIDMGVDKWRKPMEYKAMLDAHPELAQEDASKVQAYYNSLRHMSPHMAKDPVLAGSFVRTMIEQRVPGSPAIHMDTAKTLADTQKSISQVKKKEPTQFSPFIGRVPVPYSEEQP